MVRMSWPTLIVCSQYSRKYLHAAKADNSPHIYAVADQSYQSMMHNQHDQVMGAFFPSLQAQLPMQM